MTMQRVRAFLVTMAVVLGAGTMSAVAAPLLRGNDGGVAAQATEDVSEEPSEAVATEDPTEVTEDPTEAAPTEGPDDAADEADGDDRDAAAKAAAAERKAAHDAAKAERKAARAKPAKASGGKGNAHGKAVSDAARGITPPVGDCRNHGDWVSSVARGKASCDD